MATLNKPVSVLIRVPVFIGRINLANRSSDSGFFDIAWLSSTDSALRRLSGPLKHR